jgi:AcrR family transcriptional regulator
MEGSLTQLGKLAPGGHELRREVVLHHQRRRILDAVVDLVAERGYRDVSVAAIIKRAGVAKLKFYELFSSKQDAFLAAIDAGLEEVLTAVTEACAPPVDPTARIEAAIGALLACCAEHPALARALVVEAPVLGPDLGERPQRALDAFAPLLVGARESAGEGELPADLEQTVVAGLYGLLYEALLAGKPKRIGQLRPALVEFALLPFRGPTAV